MKILMVCLGNICRSPLAEGIMRNKIETKNLDWQVDSAGTSGWHSGEKPDIRSIQTSEQHNIDIKSQIARTFEVEDFDNFDLIFAMDQHNYDDIISLARNEADSKKVDMILNKIYPGDNVDVPDPYWDDDGFENVFLLLDKACETIINEQN